MSSTETIQAKQFVHTSSYRTGFVLSVSGNVAVVDFGFSPSTGRKIIESVEVEALRPGMGAGR